MRVILLVIEGFGIGELNDASLYSDENCNSYRAVDKDIELPCLRELGLDNIFKVGCFPVDTPRGSYGRMRSFSVGKQPYIQCRELLGNITYSPISDADSLHCANCEDLVSRLADNGIGTVAIGGIADYISAANTEGFNDKRGTVGSSAVTDEIVNLINSQTDETFIIASINDLSTAGKARDAQGYAAALEAISTDIWRVLSQMPDDDILIITSDNGCDPTHAQHSDYTREYVPIIFRGRSIKDNNDLGTVHGYDVVAYTILDIYGIMTAAKSIKDALIELEEQRKMVVKIKRLIKKNK